MRTRTIPENRGAAQTLHGALGVTRNAVCSPHVYHLAQHSKHEEKPQLERFKVSLSTNSFSCPKNSLSENNPLQDEEELLTH
jgi:hypothetical protein